MFSYGAVIIDYIIIELTIQKRFDFKISVVTFWPFQEPITTLHSLAKVNT